MISRCITNKVYTWTDSHKYVLTNSSWTLSPDPDCVPSEIHKNSFRSSPEAPETPTALMPQNYLKPLETHWNALKRLEFSQKLYWTCPEFLLEVLEIIVTSLKSSYSFWNAPKPLKRLEIPLKPNQKLFLNQLKLFWKSTWSSPESLWSSLNPWKVPLKRLEALWNFLKLPLELPEMSAKIHAH